MKTLYRIRETYPWMGKRSGYDRLHEETTSLLQKTYTVRDVPVRTQAPRPIRAIQRFLVSVRYSPFYTPDRLWTELDVLDAVQWTRDLVHLTYLENFIGVFLQVPSRAALIGTAHQTPHWWSANLHNIRPVLKRLDALIALGPKQAAYLERILPGRVHLIPHGIDTEFFRPGPKGSEFSVITVGHWQRDFHVLGRIIEQAEKDALPVRFHLVPGNFEDAKGILSQLSKRKSVQVHQSIADHEYLHLLQTSHALLMPMLDATANNALLEAMASGLPILSSRVGEIPYYTGSECAFLARQGHWERIYEGLRLLKEDPAVARKMGECARARALEFSWPRIAEQTVALYGRVHAPFFSSLLSRRAWRNRRDLLELRKAS